MKADCLPDLSRINRDDVISISGITDEDIFSLGSLDFTVYAKSSEYTFLAHVVDSNFFIPFDGIIGLNFLNKLDAKLDYEDWVAYLTDESCERHQLRLFRDVFPNDPIFTCRTNRILNILKANFPKFMAKE